MNNREKRTVSNMIGIYCHSKHNTKSELCQVCRELELYAYKRLENCKFGEQKPDCKHCPTHCYQKEMKQKIREVMRFSGPRMIFYYPIDAIRHFIQIVQNKRVQN